MPRVLEVSSLIINYKTLIAASRLSRHMFVIISTLLPNSRHVLWVWRSFSRLCFQSVRHTPGVKLGVTAFLWFQRPCHCDLLRIRDWTSDRTMSYPPDTGTDARSSGSYPATCSMQIMKKSGLRMKRRFMRIVLKPVGTHHGNQRQHGVQSGEISRWANYVGKMIIAFDNLKIIHVSHPLPCGHTAKYLSTSFQSFTGCISRARLGPTRHTWSRYAYPVQFHPGNLENIQGSPSKIRLMMLVKTISDWETGDHHPDAITWKTDDGARKVESLPIVLLLPCLHSLFLGDRPIDLVHSNRFAKRSALYMVLRNLNIKKDQSAAVASGPVSIPAIVWQSAILLGWG